MIAKRKAILRSSTACNTATAPWIDPVKGTLASLVFFRLKSLAEKRRHLCVSGDKGTIEIRPLEHPTTLLELARVIRSEMPNPYPFEHERLVQKCVLLVQTKL